MKMLPKVNQDEDKGEIIPVKKQGEGNNTTHPKHPNSTAAFLFHNETLRVEIAFLNIRHINNVKMEN